MLATVRSRALGWAASAESAFGSVRSLYLLVAHRVHAGRVSDIHALHRRRSEDPCRQFPGHFLPAKLLSLQGELVDRGTLSSASASAALSRSLGEPPEIWKQPPDSGASQSSGIFDHINVVKVGGGGGGGSGGGDGCGFGHDREWCLGDFNLDNEFPTPKEICRCLDKFVIGQERAKKICVSSVEPMSFLLAVEAGALMIEIGNYDSFYEMGIQFSSEQILKLTRETKSMLPSITLSVTVPHTLSIPDQVMLAELLEQEGVDVIQTEGGKYSKPSQPGVMGLIEKATPSIAAAYSISRAVKIPVMCSSGLSAVTAPMALAAGAAGVGVGSAVNKLNDVVAMIAEVKSLSESLGLSKARLHEKLTSASSA